MIHDVHLLILTEGFVPIPLFWTSRARGNLGNGAGVTVASWLPQVGTSVRPVPGLPDYRYTLHVRVPPGEPQLTHGTYKHLDLEKSRWKMHKL